MAVLNVKRKITGNAASIDERTELVDVWTVLTDSVDDNQMTAANAAGLPLIGDGHSPAAPFATLQARRGRQVSQYLYEVDCIYRSSAGGTTQNQNPLDEPAKRRFVGIRSTEIVDWALDENNNPTVAMVNTAGITIEAPQDMNDGLYTVEWNVADVSFAQIVQYQDAVNSDYWNALPGQAKVEHFDAVYVITGALNYWTKSISIRFRRGLPAGDVGGGALHGAIGGPARAWWRRVRNQGRRERIGAFGASALHPGTKEIVDENGATPSEPVPLDANGLAIRTEGAAVIWLEFKRYPTLPFSVLGIP